MRDRKVLEQRRAELEAELGEPITLDGLTGTFSIYQRRRGHRHSTDDLLTAWYAHVHGAPDAKELCDLGTGIGSVALMLASARPAAHVTAIEVQAVSYRFLRENVWANDVDARVRTIHGDLRDFVADRAFDLVTGSPPYFDVKDGIVSPDPQRAGARFELKGDVRDYCRAAHRALAPRGRFVFCFPTVQRVRAEAACEGASLRIVRSCDVIPRVGLSALFSLFVCERADADPPSEIVARTEILAVRDESGVHTAEMNAARGLFSLGP